MPDTAPARHGLKTARVAEFFEDAAVRQGLKMALGGILGFAAALWLRLPNPTWCIFTVIVLMMAQYVGAIAEKAVLRAVGTVAGATIGILLVGNFASDPAVMVAGSFLVAAFGTMMFGGNRYPYAFFLGALTALVVVGNTMENPADAWHVGVSRILEICLGILISTTVTGVIWPRYARVEFGRDYCAALREAGRVAVARSRRLLECDVNDPSLVSTELRFSARMNTLRLLLRYGQRESEYFRAKLPIRRSMTGELGALFEAAQSLGQRLPRQSRYRDLISAELNEIHTRIEREFDALETPREDLDRINAPIAAAIARCDARLVDLREQGLTRGIPVQEAMDFSAHYTALIDIAARLKIIRECLHEIHSTLEVPAPGPRSRSEPFRITGFWVRNGIKSGLTAALALTYVNWIHPPGGLTVPFAAWLLTATSRLYPGGQGDRRAFGYVITIALAGIPCALLLFVLTPYLANYLWMNVLLAAGLFALGFTIARQGGFTLYGQCGMLFFIGAVGLNAQKPVPFQQIVDVYFGVVIALALSATIQRLLWPLLPQREICSLFAELFTCCRRLLEPLDDEELIRNQERIALIPPEMAAWIRVTTTPEYPAGERQKLLDLLQSAERLGYCILSARKLDRIHTPPEVGARMREHLAALDARCREALTDFEAAFERETSANQPASLLAAFQPIERELSDIRQRYLSGAMPFPAAIAYLGAMNFLEDAARTIDCCAGQLRGLSLEKYRGDYAL
ncbi:MAG: FUSC family protein [Terrimicrobiaceae bacterium]|nr:FUSC family protein [Terrimicrobiaceae bacterium]